MEGPGAYFPWHIPGSLQTYLRTHHESDDISDGSQWWALTASYYDDSMAHLIGLDFCWFIRAGFAHQGRQGVRAVTLPLRSVPHTLWSPQSNGPTQRIETPTSVTCLSPNNSTPAPCLKPPADTFEPMRIAPGDLTDSAPYSGSSPGLLRLRVDVAAVRRRHASPGPCDRQMRQAA